MRTDEPPMPAAGIHHPLSFLATGWRHRSLIGRLAWRQIQSRQRGSMLGMAWTVLHPLMMLGVYTFVFSVVFEARWGAPGADRADFALFLFAGMIVYTIFSQCVNEAPRLMLNHHMYIQQMRFPIEVFSWVSLVGALFDFAVSALVLMVFFAFEQGVPPLAWLYLPLVLVPVGLLSLAASWFLSSIGVFFRDIAQVTGVLTTALLFLSPIFYPATRIPEAFRPFYFVNPFATLLEMFKATFFDGTTPAWGALALLFVVSWGLAWSGYAWFMRTKKGFADVL